jgi:hypothetical protein
MIHHVYERGSRCLHRSLRTGRGDRSVVGCIFPVNLPLIAVAFAGGIALLSNSRADSTGRVRLRGCVAVHGGCRSRVTLSPKPRLTDDGLFRPARLRLFDHTQCFQVVLRHPKAGLSILPFSPLGMALTVRIGPRGLLSASECLRSLPVSWHPRRSPPLLTTGLVVAAINGFRVLRGFLRRSPDKYHAGTSRLGDADPAEAERHKRVPQPKGEIEPAIPVRVREVGIPTHTTYVPGWARAFVGCRLLSR